MIVCYSKLKKNLKIDLNDPFTTNYFDENSLLSNSESFFDELNSISVFSEKKTIIIDIRQSDKKVKLKFSIISIFQKIKDTQLIILATYLNSLMYYQKNNKHQKCNLFYLL